MHPHQSFATSATTIRARLAQESALALSSLGIPAGRADHHPKGAKPDYPIGLRVFIGALIVFQTSSTQKIVLSIVCPGNAQWNSMTGRLYTNSHLQSSAIRSGSCTGSWIAGPQVIAAFARIAFTFSKLIE